jgi:hypothetical protein
MIRVGGQPWTGTISYPWYLSGFVQARITARLTSHLRRRCIGAAVGSQGSEAELTDTPLEKQQPLGFHRYCSESDDTLFGTRSAGSALAHFATDA